MLDFSLRSSRPIDLRWLARVLYPDAFPLDPRPIVRDLYTCCYHQAPTGAQRDQLPARGSARG